MPKAEVGTPKYLANKMKSKGLQRLRWYCQICEKQMRDENGFRCHANSEGHVRQMLIVGQNPNRQIGEYSRQFKHDFLQLLRTSHGEKRVQANHFYQEYIGNKEHIHMTGTHWKTLTEFVKGLGREGICRVDENEKGFFIAWIDNSPEALRRQEAIRRKDRQDKGDEERHLQLIQEQVNRANEELVTSDPPISDAAVDLSERPAEEKLKISFGVRATAQQIDANIASITTSVIERPPKKPNVFAAAQKKALAPTPSTLTTSKPRQKSAAEQIALAELDKQRRAEDRERYDRERGDGGYRARMAFA